MIQRSIGYFLVVVVFSFLIGCAGRMSPDYEPPVVNLQSFQALPQSGFAPRFEIWLNIINPNSEPLDLEGIYYTIDIEGYRVLSGVSGDLPIVGAYSEADITLIATTDILSSIRFFSSLIQQPRDTFHYSFNAKLDPGGFAPNIRIEEEGVFSFNQGR